MATAIAFEIQQTDLMGRIGQLTVGKRRIETPCLFPVIHPVERDIPIAAFERMGFHSLMTNSFIIYKRRKQEALEKGLHSMLGFDGMLMTDSGGYQSLEYGQVEIDPLTIASFQARIGSDLAVTLDRPTGYSWSESYARETVDFSLRAAILTIRKLGGSGTRWVGPIQGGLFGSLVASSARRLVKAGFEMLALGSPTQIMEGYLFSDLVRMIVAAKRSVPYSLPMHLFGAGHPLTMPLTVALGCDTFDSASYVLFAKQGRYMTERGTLELDAMQYLPCSCEVCVSSSCGDLREMDRDERVRKVALHNLHVLRAELLKCKQALAEGRLWDLVVERAESHPRLKRAMRVLAGNQALLQHGTAMLKERGLLIRGSFDVARPELDIARRHLRSALSRRAPTAALIVSREEKPLPRLKVYQKLLERFGNSDVDVYRVHPELGIYPAELEYVYPFGQTVHADRGLSPSATRNSIRSLRSLGYEKIVLCSGERIRRTA